MTYFLEDSLRRSKSNNSDAKNVPPPTKMKVYGTKNIVRLNISRKFCRTRTFLFLHYSLCKLGNEFSRFEKKRRVSVCLSTRVRRFHLSFIRFLSKTILTHIVPVSNERFRFKFIFGPKRNGFCSHFLRFEPTKTKRSGAP